jgi:hypothetical protein
MPVSSAHSRTISGLSGSPAATAWRSVGSRRSPVRLAIVRYSVGAMQSTFTPSRSTTARRSSGSKRASWSRAVAPRTQGAMKTLRADFDQPLAAVHQQRSPGRAPNQCSAWTR